MSFAGVLLAAGRSRRMGAANKLLADLGGAPLVARAFANARASQATPLIVVTGHMAAEVRAALGDQPAATFIHNPAFADGMASSLRAGLGATPASAPGAVILLGDMPLIAPQVIDRIIAEAVARPDAAAVVPVVAGEWAHPVLLRRTLFAEVSALAGDSGARRILAPRADVATLALDDPGCLMDADDPAALDAVRRRFASGD